MKSVLLRTVSVPVHTSTADNLSFTGILSPGKSHVIKCCSLHVEVKDNNKSKSKIIRRTVSDAAQVIPATPERPLTTRSRSFPKRIPEEGEEVGSEELILERKGLDLDRLGRIWRKSTEGLKEEVELSGGGIGKGKNVGGGDDKSGGGGGYSDEYYKGRNAELSDHYEKLLKADPGNALVLRNYGKFLHEVKKDLVKAEECYGRAILASPGDGEVLSQYGKLIWESYRDEEKADSYFNQALEASPDNCYVMGSYASFLWDAEEEEEETNQVQLKVSAPTLLEAC